VYSVELAYGRQLEGIGQVSLGLISKIDQTGIKSAPIINLYKNLQVGRCSAALELGYNFLTKQLSGYATLRYDL
jgi:hypothetical protein